MLQFVSVLNLMLTFVSIGVTIFISTVIYTDPRFVARKYSFFSTLSIVDVTKNDDGKITCVAEGTNITISLEGMSLTSLVASQ